jgi:acyl carrier protein
VLNNGVDEALFTAPFAESWQSASTDVSAYGNSPLRSRLTASLIPEVRQYLGDRLPEYMIPATFTILDRLPLLPNGKADYKAMLALTGPGLSGVGTVAPQSSLEIKVAQIWCGVLGLERVGITDNFFTIGGHSLLAIKLVSEIRREFDVDIPLRNLFEAPTVSGMVRMIDGERTAASSGPIDYSMIVPDEDQRYEPFPLTDVQYAYWIGRTDAFELGNIAAHGYLELDTTEVDVDRLGRAWQRSLSGTR